MKKKTFIVQLLDSKKPSRTSFTQVEDANFYSNDTDASLVFIPHEDTFDFQSAKVVMFNRGDESLVERDMQVTTEEGRKVASYEIPEEIISHWGQWIAQPVFISGGEIYSGAIVPFSVERHLMHERPPKLTEVVTVTKFVEQSQELVNAMIQAEAQRITEEQDRQSAEAVRLQSESERSTWFETARPKVEQSITKSAEALIKSQNALNVANGIDAKATNALSLSESADTLSKSVQEQFNQVIIDGDSSVEAAQARVDAGGETNATLKARLDKEHNEVTAQLAQITYNVKSFGAVGDGLLDDTSAIQNALNAVGSDSELYFPRGTYLISGELILPTGIKIIGQDKYLSKIKLKDGVVSNALSGINVSNVVIKSLGVIGNKSTISNTATSRAINLQNGSRNLITDCHIKDMRQYGVYFQDTTHSEVSHNIIEHIGNGTTTGPAYSADGILLQDGCHYNNIINNTIEHINDMGIGATNIDGDGIQLSGGGNEAVSNNKVVGNIIRYCGSRGIKDQSSNNELSGNLIEFCRTGIGMIAVDYTKGNVISGNIIRSGAYGITFSGAVCSLSVISSNVFEELSDAAHYSPNGGSVVDCTFIGNQYNSIGGNVLSVSGNRIRFIGNNIYDFGWNADITTSDAYRSAILLLDSTGGNHLIDGNSIIGISDSSNVGVHCYRDVKTSIVKNNHINTAKAPISVTSSEPWIFQDNLSDDGVITYRN